MTIKVTALGSTPVHRSGYPSLIRAMASPQTGEYSRVEVGKEKAAKAKATATKRSLIPKVVVATIQEELRSFTIAAVTESVSKERKEM